jgi:predicted extracellular nuclease
VFVARRAPARPLTTALIVALAIAILPASAARPVFAAGTINLTSSGSAYAQDFNSLATTGTSSDVPAGWEFVESGTNANTTYTAGTGSGNAGDTYGFGVSDSTERAFGGLQSGSLVPTIGANFTNAIGSTITALAITYTGEQWRLGTLARPDRLDFQYSLTATSLTTGTWTDVDALDLTAPTTGPTVGALDGNAAANRMSPSATIPGLVVPTGATIWIRWLDFNASGADDGLAVDDFSLTPTADVIDDAPAVTSSTPSDGATGVAKNAALSITFSEQVVIDSGAVTLTCDGSPRAASVSGDPGMTFPITYLPPLPDGASCVIGVTASGIHDTDTADPPDTMASDVSIDFTVVAADPCAGGFTSIPAIQGSGASAAITGTVTTEGVVVGDFEGASSSTLRGYYIQDPAGDGNAATSDGIFVFNSPNTTAVNLGDSVRVTGDAADFQDQTQITQSAVVVCSTGATVAPTEISFPVAPGSSLEPYEGMLVRVPQTLTVTEHFQLGRFGQVLLSSDGRLDVPTAVVEPGAPAAALQAANNLRKILVDDASQAQNPDPIVFARGGQPLSASNTLRGGDTATGIVGVMTYTWGGQAMSPNAFRIRPINALGGQIQFVAANARPGPTVDVAGGVRVAALNLLNYFNTFSGCTQGVGGVTTGCRGAENATEFGRQVPKTVAAILGLNADVVGVNEIENDGYGPTSSIAHLVDALNAVAGAGTYAFIDADAATGQLNALGDDAIKVGLIYRPAAVTPVGDTAVLNTPEFVLGGDDPPDPPLPQLRSRPSLAQAFETPDGARFIVDVNHFKSKGSPCDEPDAGDGQGNCNIVRKNGARELVAWLGDDPTGTGDEDVLIMGDLNSYAKEDPIDVLTGAGYINLVAALDDPYSYVFDGQWGYLDYALASPTARDQAAGVVEWHINSDEPSVLDYNTNFKSAGQINSLYAPDRFRVSDHDPIVVGLDAATDRPSVDAGGPYLVEELGTVQLTATGSDPTGDDITFAWDLDGLPGFEASGAQVTFAAGTLQAPQTVTVTVRVTDEHGQWAQDTATIDVIWDFGGFLAPSNPSGVTQIKAGASHPVKFSLDGDQGLDVLGGNLLFQRHACPTGAPIGSPIIAAQAEPFSYDPLTDTYKFVWKTQRAWAGWCGTLAVPLADGQTYSLEVAFKP